MLTKILHTANTYNIDLKIS